MYQRLFRFIFFHLKLQIRRLARLVKQYPFYSTIAGIVIILHFSVVIYSLVNWSFPKKKVSSHQIQVRTIVLTTPPSVEVVKKKEVKQVARVVEASLPKEKNIKKSSSATKKKVTSSEEKKQRRKQQELLKSIQETLASVEHEEVELNLDLMSVPKVVSNLHIEKESSVVEELSEDEMGYEKELVTRLQLLLRLPEKGDVQLELSLNRNGSVQTIRILNSQSSRNVSYIQQTLPSVQFPEFGVYFKDEKQRIFNLTLTSQG